MYSAFDLKDCRYLSTGRNSKSYEQCFDAIKSLMVLEDDDELAHMPDKKLLQYMGVRIDKHGKRVDIGANECLSRMIIS